MPRETVEPVLGDDGFESHPAWGSIRAARVSGGSGTLFQSDVRHQHSVTVTITPAERKRDLNHDWVHEKRRPFIEIQMSESQWASFVSSMNSSGTPCTVRYLDGQAVPEMPHQPRIAESLAEVKDAAEKAFAGILEAFQRYEATPATPKKAKDAARASLRHRIEGAPRNITWTAECLAEHAEDTLNRMKAEIEAIVDSRARQLGIDPTHLQQPLQLNPAED